MEADSVDTEVMRWDAEESEATEEMILELAGQGKPPGIIRTDLGMAVAYLSRLRRHVLTLLARIAELEARLADLAAQRDRAVAERDAWKGLAYRASDKFDDCAPDENWWRDYFLITRTPMVLTDEGWESPECVESYRADDPNWKPLDVVCLDPAAFGLASQLASPGPETEGATEVLGCGCTVKRGWRCPMHGAP